MAKLLTGIAGLACAVGVLATGCAKPTSHDATQPQVSIGKIASLRDQFGPEFTVKTIEPTGLDPKLLAPSTLPSGLSVDPPDCAKYGVGTVVPPDIQGNMAALTAVGAGNQYVAVAVETSQEIPATSAPPAECRTFSFRGNGIAGQTELLDAPAIDGVRTLATKRDVLSGTSGQAIGQEVLNYSAYFGRYMVVVTVNPISEGDVPPALPDGERAAALLVKAVAAIRS